MMCSDFNQIVRWILTTSVIYCAFDLTISWVLIPFMIQCVYDVNLIESYDVLWLRWDFKLKLDNFMIYCYFKVSLKNWYDVLWFSFDYDVNLINWYDCIVIFIWLWCESHQLIWLYCELNGIKVKLDNF